MNDSQAGAKPQSNDQANQNQYDALLMGNNMFGTDMLGGAEGMGFNSG